MEYCLIEKWDRKYPLPSGSQAVALTEEAIFRLEQQGIPYIQLEDFYRSFEIRGDVNDFNLKQLSWFNDFDEVLKEAFPEADQMGVSLATIYYYGLKRAVDNVILTTRILRKFIEAVNPSRIYYVGPPPRHENRDCLIRSGFPEGHPFDEILDPDFKTSDNPFSLLIEPLSSSYGIDFKRLTLDIKKTSQQDRPIVKDSRMSEVKHHIKRWGTSILPASDIRSLLISLKSLRARPQTQGRVLLLRYSGLMEDFCVDLRREGYKIYVKNEASIKELSWWPWRKGVKIEPVRPRICKPQKDKMEAISRGALTEWINHHCGKTVAGILDSRLKYFFYKICPELLSKIRDYKQLYINNHIDFVVSPNIWTIDEHAAVAAARVAPRTKSVGFAHGSDVYECKSRFFYLDRQYDIFFSLSEDEADHERNLAEEFHYQYPTIFAAPYLQKRMGRKTKKNRRVKPASFSGQRRLVLFVPIIYGIPPGRSMQLNQPFPIEFVQWHQELAEFLSKRKDFFFIWKGLIQPEQNFDLMAEVIKEKGYENIRYDSGRLTRWFPFADRILLDIPSTAYFESIYSHMPVMALYRPAYQRLRPNAIGRFGPSLQAFNSIDEGLTFVEKFLDGHRDDYIVPFNESNGIDPKDLHIVLRPQSRSNVASDRIDLAQEAAKEVA